MHGEVADEFALVMVMMMLQGQLQRMNREVVDKFALVVMVMMMIMMVMQEL